jgi:YD repeat-containing protein
VEDPAGNRVQVTHDSTGLLRELRDPRDRVFRFGYDVAGRLLADTAPDGGIKALEREVGDSGYAVTLTSALGRATTYAVGLDGKQGEIRTVTDPAGLETRTWRTSAGEDSTRTPDGTLTVVRRAGDPRWGTAVAFPGRLLVRLPSGDSSVITNRRSAVSDSANPFTLLSETDSTTINGQLWRTAYDAATQRVTTTSPVGRQSFTTLDSLGRVRVVRTPGLDSVVYGYDARGRLQQVQTGGRVASYTYDGAGRLATTTDPLGRTDSLFYDGADRLLRQVLPGGREIAFAPDSSGKRTSVTQPSGARGRVAWSMYTLYIRPVLRSGGRTWHPKGRVAVGSGERTTGFPSQSWTPPAAYSVPRLKPRPLSAPSIWSRSASGWRRARSRLGDGRGATRSTRPTHPEPMRRGSCRSSSSTPTSTWRRSPPTKETRPWPRFNAGTPPSSSSTRRSPRRSWSARETNRATTNTMRTGWPHSKTSVGSSPQAMGRGCERRASWRAWSSAET